MMKDVIFIHIPKTGGTTINSAMQGTYWQSEPDFNYRHIEAGNKQSNAGDIFDPKNIFKYRDYKIFMMLREPVDRLISEYHFIRERKEFIGLLRTNPRDFEDYILSKQTQNGVVSFLKGKRMYDVIPAKRSDLDDILLAIDKIPVHVGIFESFEKSLQYFTDVSGIQWKKKIEVKRMTFVRPKVAEVTQDIKDLIIKNNPLDAELYNYCFTKFNRIAAGISVPNIVFTKDKYNHVIPYVNKWCLFEFCMENKKFIKENFTFFKELTFFLLKQKNISDGRQFTEVWNRTFLHTIELNFPETPFSHALRMSYQENGDQLEQTLNIAKALDDFFDQHKKTANEYYKPLVFNQNMVVSSKSGFGFLRNLFR
jgi:hypothetical protein